MSDFFATIASGVTLVPWLDPAATSPTRPSRVNARTKQTHMRWLGTVGVQIQIEATVPGLGTAPLDATLGGRLFSASLVEKPGVPHAFTSPAGQSSVQRFTPVNAGHYTIELRRASGGALLIHVDVQ